MIDSKPVLIARSRIGDLSLLHSIWSSGAAHDAVFLADYAINPLGTKSDSTIADAASHWLSVVAGAIRRNMEFADRYRVSAKP